MTVITDIEQNSMNPIDTFKTTGLGARLKSAREAMSLSAKEAATHLHLSVNIINIIENEQFADGPPPAFMRGYLRAYARFLNIPDIEISKTLQALDITSPIKSTTLPILKTRSAKKTDRYLHSFTYLLLITMATLVGLWWHSHQRYVISDVPTQTTQPAPAPTTTVAPAPVAPLPTAPSASPSEPVVAPTPMTTANPVNSPATIVTTPTTEITTAVPTDIPAGSTDTNTAPAVTQTTPAPATTMAPSTQPAAAPPPEVDMPPIISTTLDSPTALTPPQTQAPVASTAPKPVQKHKNNRRNATLPGMPGVNMTLPEPN